MTNITDIRICFVGDSFVNGTGDPDCLGWTGRLCASRSRQGRSITYYNLGVRRETSADICDRRHDVAIGDGAHPAAAGYAALASMIEEWSSWKTWF
jgi:lysophospholipase L1-like esterase